MLEAISKNWGYLTTIGAIIVAAFGAGAWVNNSLKALNTLPDQVSSLDARLNDVEKVPHLITQSACALEAQLGMSKNEVLQYTIDLRVEQIREEVMLLESLDRDWSNAEKRRHERLAASEQELVRARNEFQSKYQQLLDVYGNCNE